MYCASTDPSANQVASLRLLSLLDLLESASYPMGKGVKMPELEADHSRLSSAKVKNLLDSTPTPPTPSWHGT
jgi:hypothetical protein